MRILKHPLYLLFCLIALLVFLAQWSSVTLPSWISFYLNDLLCMPIILSSSLALTRFIKKDANIYAPFPAIFGLTLFYAVYFEWLLPKINTRYTGDVFDVILYIIGALIFLNYQKRLF